MERLTFFKNGLYWIRLNGTWYGGFPEVDRLAAYEDTGLEPCDYSAMRAAIDQSAEYKKQLSDVVDILGCSDIEHLKDIFQAEKDGRLVVLPCKPDATAYQWKRGDDILSLFRFYGVTINEDGEIAYQTHWEETFKPDDFGKTVFLTREEAEAAMKKRAEDNER